MCVHEGQLHALTEVTASLALLALFDLIRHVVSDLVHPVTQHDKAVSGRRHGDLRGFRRICTVNRDAEEKLKY